MTTGCARYLVLFSIMLSSRVVGAEPFMPALEALLVDPDTSSVSSYGRAVDVQTDLLVIGAPNRTVSGTGSKLGAVHIFSWDGSAWLTKGEFLGNSSNDYLGSDVALSGERLIAGAPAAYGYLADDGYGSASIFSRGTDGSWSLEERIVPVGMNQWSYFGGSVDIVEDRVVIGASNANVPTYGHGAAFVYTQDGTGWSYEATLVHPVPGLTRSYASALSYDGARAALGAPSAGVSPEETGAVHVWLRSGASWTLEQEITVMDGLEGDHFGNHVAIDDDRLLVTASGRNEYAGAVYAFARTVTGWHLEQRIDSPIPEAHAFFGRALALDGDRALIGADESAFLYRHDGTSWMREYRIDPPELDSNSRFGQSVSLDGNLGLIGAYYEDTAALYDLDHLLLRDGELCPSEYPCESGYCVDGVCCESSCGGGTPFDCQACSVPEGATLDGICDVSPSSYTCRPAIDTCDVDEYCSGSSRTCPFDTWVEAGVICRPSAGGCDVAEACRGDSGRCPEDALLPIGALCRPTAGPCDVTEGCDGTTPECPPDRFVAAETECRPSLGACDAPELCVGDSADCPPDVFRDSSVQCRPASGLCDLSETCPGDSADCPPDQVLEAGELCRAQSDECDRAEYCDGSTPECPTDLFAEGGTPCRLAAGLCDRAEHCSGTGPRCPEDEYYDNRRLCRPDRGVCDTEEHCSGADAHCPADDHGALDGQTCDDGLAWTVDDTCAEGSCVGQPLGTCNRAYVIDHLPAEVADSTTNRPPAVEQWGEGCAGAASSSGEIVYELHLEADSEVEIVLEPRDGFDGVLRLARECTGAADCLDSSDVGLAGELESLQHLAEEDEVLYVIVAGRDGTEGGFVLHLRLIDDVEPDADIDGDIDIDADLALDTDAEPDEPVIDADVDESWPAGETSGCGCRMATTRATTNVIRLVMP